VVVLGWGRPYELRAACMHLSAKIAVELVLVCRQLSVSG